MLKPVLLMHRSLHSLTLMCTLLWSTQAEEFRPNLGPDLESITIHCGDVTLLLRQRSQWTPGRIDFRSVPMTTERSAYGTVISFPEVGFIGTGHLENEPEELTKLTFLLDGTEIKEPGNILKGQRFRFVRESRIRDFDLRCEFEIQGARLIETTTLRTKQAVPLKLLYHFMHAWKPSMSELIAGSDDQPQKLIVHPLQDHQEVDRKMYLNARVDWMAIFDPDSRQFAVSRLLEAPGIGGHEAKVWNVPGTYRKFYLMCFSNETVPAGFEGTWRMVTAFGAADASEWQDRARKLAGNLNE